MAEPLPLAQVIDPEWAQALTPVENQIRQMGVFLRTESAAGRGFLPSGINILRAFIAPLTAVRVLIVGQDPYPTPGHAMGLSFSVPNGVKPLPPSLQNILAELRSDLGLPPPNGGDLSPWAERGVMLLNRVLSVRPGKPASHRGQGWEEITAAAIDALVARGGPLVAILWGNDARSLGPRLGTVPRIESPHPSPLAAHRGFFGSKPFSRANAALTAQGAPPVDWSLG